MTTATILQAASRAIGRLDRFGSVLTRVPVSGHSEVQDVLKPLVNHDWSAVHVHATARRVELDAVLADWLAWRTSVDDAGRAVAAVETVAWTRPVDDPSWPRRRATIVATLRDRGVRDPEGTADDMGAQSTKTLAAALGGPAARSNIALAASSDQLVAGRHAVLLLDVASSFHLVAPRKGRVSMRPVAQVTTLLDRAEQSFWTAVSGGAVAAAGGALADAAEGVVPAVVDTAAHLARARSKRPDTLVDEAIAAGDLMRRALTLAAAGRAAQLTHDPERWQRAARLPVVRSGAPVATAPSVPVDGQRATVRGVLGPVTIRHRGPMAISTAPLQCGDQVVTLLSTHIKLDSGGLVAGAAAVVTGTWMLDHPDADGPALFLRRDQVAANANKDRDAWVLQRLRYTYVPVPHRLAVRASVEPGRGVAGPLIFDTFAADPRGGS